MKIGIVGCAGRMGRMLINAVLDTPGCALAGGTERPGADMLGTDLGRLVGRGPTGCVVEEDPMRLFREADAVIDFTLPEATVLYAALAAATNTAMIIGTTGLTPEQENKLAEAARRIPIVYAPNYSVGVNLLLALVERASAILRDDYDVEIIEMHHRLKTEAPSGTALDLAQAAAGGRGVALSDVWCKARDGHTGPRPSGQIGISSLRGGDVIGDHTILFAADGERVELSHKASNRTVFARGAVRAALWSKGRSADGLYTMRDVLGL